MSRRSIATVHRPAQHLYQPSTDTPNVCRCGLPKSNSVHQIEDHTAEQAEHCRRAGEDL